jgi:outer membrane receptor protein involved in Fe transport
MKQLSAAFLCYVVLVFLWVAAPLAAQGYKATLVGRITDQTGAVVNQAHILVTNLETNHSVSASSEETGNFVITQLPPGRYQLRIEAKDFKTFVRAGLTLQVDQTARVDAVLTIGSVSAEVIVRDEAPLIATESAALGGVITNREIVDIPLNGRNYLALAALAPGVVPAAAGANPHNINGARADSVNYLIDGVSNVNRRGNEPVAAPSLDAIREFKILTNNFSAEYGRLGGGVISVALKSGTNQFHGTLFEFLRNDALDARGFFDQQVPKLKRNQFGGVLSGPLKPERTFFLFSYEGLRNRETQTRLARMPTAQERAGMFATAIRNPATRQPFADNRIPAELIHPLAAQLLALFPAANRSGALNYSTVGALPSNSDSYIAKLDQHVGRAGLLSGRFLLNATEARDPFRSTVIPGFDALRRVRKQAWSLSYTHSFGTRLVNETRFGFLRENFAERSVNAGQNTSAEFGLPGVANGFGLANFNVIGFPELGDPVFLPDEWTDNEYVVSDTASLLTGQHNLRLGGDFQRSQHFNLFAAYAGGQLVFQGLFTGQPFADFLLGLPVQTQRQVGTNKSYLFNNYFGVFAQDDWKLRPRLTLNLGLRYDVAQPPVEKFDRYANFVPSARRTVAAGEPGYPRALVKTDYRNFAPRFGFAWRPWGGDQTVLRGGYGIFYSFDLQYTMYTYLGANAAPFTRLELFQDTRPGGLTLTAPFPSDRLGAAPTALSPSGWEVENPTAYTQQWNLSVARELFGTWGVEASYVGAKGTHLSATLNLNQTIRTPQGNVQPFPGLSRVLYQSLGANSLYHALQLSVNKRLSQGLAFRSSLTWAKALDNATFGSAARQPQNPRDLQAERALADFDRRWVSSSDFIYELPFGRGRRLGKGLNRTLEALAGGWQLNGILHFYSGRPFTPVAARANAQGGFATRPDRLRDGALAQPTPERWFDPAAFAVVPNTEFRFGNAGRNILTGPGAVVVDASVLKQFALPWETHRLEFRAEFFNLPNRANFGQPAAGVDLPTAGVIGSAGPGRQIQLVLKYLF